MNRLLEGYEVLRSTGSQVIRDQPILSKSVDFIYSHPWPSLGIATGAYITWKFMTRRRDLPPGPFFRIPLIGNTRYLTEEMEIRFTEDREIYGDIMMYNMFGKEYVVINGEKLIKEAFLKHGEDFAHRPDSSNLLDLKDEIFSAPYNDVWKDRKKFFVSTLKDSGFGTAKSEDKIHRVLDRFLGVLQKSNQKPVKISEHIDVVQCSMIMAVFYNLDLEFDDPKLLKITKAAKVFLDSVNDGMAFMMSMIFEQFPMIQKMVLKRNQKKLLKGVDVINGVLKEMIQEHRATFDKTDMRDIIDHFLANRPDIDDDTLAANLLVILPDAIDTTGVVITAIFHFIAQNQDIQKKARDQIEELIGSEKNPTLSDKANLALTEAIILETLRITDLIPISLPREMATDLKFGGYTIPKATSVMSNNHSVHYDPQIFPNPGKFDATRFLNSAGKIDPNKASNILTFGIGRRMCMGQMFAKTACYHLVVRVLQKYNVTFAAPEPPAFKYMPGIIKGITEHGIIFTPR